MADGKKRSRQPMATRQLTWHADSGERAVLIRVWPPVTFKRDIYCDYAIDGLAEPIRGASMGTDSLQALTLALRCIWLELAPLRNEVYWNGTYGWLGLSFSFDYAEDFQQQRRVEHLVETEEKRYFERVLRPLKRHEERLQQLYDPDARETEYTEFSTEEMLDELRVAAAREKRYHDEENTEGATFFYSKCWSIAGALSKKPDRQVILEKMTGEQHPRLRLLAAELLGSSAISQATLLKLCDDNVEPQASEARRALKFRQRIAARPRPWDGEDAVL